jgi:purine-binding chemotaxis protein CheW
MSNQKTVTEKQLVIFNLDGGAYGVDISVVREIIHVQDITRVPGTPLSIEGVINLRGSVIPVVDLRKCFLLNAIQRDKNMRIVVINCRNQDVGVVVDSVAEVLRVPVDSIETPSNVITGGNLEYLLGIVKMTNRLVILLDMDQILCRQDIAAFHNSEFLKETKVENYQKEKVRETANAAAVP